MVPSREIQAKLQKIYEKGLERLERSYESKKRKLTRQPDESYETIFRLKIRRERSNLSTLV